MPFLPVKPEDLTVEERVRYGRFPDTAWDLGQLAELALVAMDMTAPRARPSFRRGFSAIESLVTVQKRAQLDWGERLE